MSDEPAIEVVAQPDSGPQGTAAAAYLRLHLPRAAAHLRRPVARCAVRIVGDATMAALHERTLNIPGPTDVLTFDSTPVEPGAGIDVDIAVCQGEALRNLEGRRSCLEQELLLYAVHGLLHCDGFDDVTEAGAAAMHVEEDRILVAIGLGPAYREGSPS